MKTKAKPLVEIRTPVRARAYRGRFKPYETTKFLDARALKSVRKASIEVGTVEAAGFKQAVVAEIRDGKIVALRPAACEGCAPRKKPAKVGSAALKKAMEQVGSRLVASGAIGPVKPIPIRISARSGLRIPIGPIIIVLGEPPYGIDLCLEWWNGNTFCWWCLIGASGCITFG